MRAHAVDPPPTIHPPRGPRARDTQLYPPTRAYMKERRQIALLLRAYVTRLIAESKAPKPDGGAAVVGGMQDLEVRRHMNDFEVEFPR